MQNTLCENFFEYKLIVKNGLDAAKINVCLIDE